MTTPFDQPDGTVIAVQVREVDPPQFIAEDMTDLQDRYPGTWGGEQCDGCGCCAYAIERDSKFDRETVLAWTARCCGDEDEAKRWESEGAEPATVEAVRTGCGAVYPLRFLPESEVAF